MNIQRLAQAMRDQSVSQTELARRIGVTQGAVHQLVSGRTVRSRYAPQIASALGVPLNWLLGEDGPAAGRMASAEVEMVQLTEVDIGYGMGGGTFIEEHAESAQRVFDPAWLGEITRSPPAMLFIARGIGDSMMPTLLDNDVLIVDRAQRRIAQQDRIWALTYGDLGMVKRVRRRPNGTFLLMSDNPAISDVEASEDELNVVGRIVWIGRKA